MKSVKDIVLDGLKFFRQQLLSDTVSQSDSNHALSRAGGYSLQQQINELNQSILDKIYPVGSIYLSVVNTSPASFIGGTWTALSNGYILRIITSGTGGAENAASNTGTNNGNTGPASGSTANSTAFDSGPASGSTANSTAFDSGAASGNTGKHTLLAAESGIPAHTHQFSSKNNVMYAVASQPGTEHGMEANYANGGNKFWSFSNTVENNTAANASSGHDHSLNNHKHSVGAHSHGLNSHKHSVGAHSHGLNSHKHSVGAHNHGLNNHTHTLNNHDHTPGMPANISVYGWKRTA